MPADDHYPAGMTGADPHFYPPDAQIDCPDCADGIMEEGICGNCGHRVDEAEWADAVEGARWDDEDRDGR